MNMTATRTTARIASTFSGQATNGRGPCHLEAPGDHAGEHRLEDRGPEASGQMGQGPAGRAVGPGDGT